MADNVGAKKKAKVTAKKTASKKLVAKKAAVKKAPTKKTAAKKPAVKKQVKQAILKLPSSADIVYVDEFVKQAKNLTKQNPKSVVIDGSEVTRMTTPCVQVMLSLAQSLGNKKVSYSIKSPSQAMEDAFNDLGLKDEFNKWSNAK